MVRTWQPQVVSRPAPVTVTTAAPVWDTVFILADIHKCLWPQRLNVQNLHPNTVTTAALSKDHCLHSIGSKRFLAAALVPGALKSSSASSSYVPPMPSMSSSSTYCTICKARGESLPGHAARNSLVLHSIAGFTAKPIMQASVASKSERYLSALARPRLALCRTLSLCRSTPAAPRSSATPAIASLASHR